jgi:hypothetical protein
MSAEAAVREYYEALRRGEPLYPFFEESTETWKAAISTTYEGYDAVAEGVREQTRTTEEWTVDSRALDVVERDGWATFTDDVALAWTTTETDAHPDASTDDGRCRHEHETRWSGVLVAADGDWVFAQLHVSAAKEV